MSGDAAHVLIVDDDERLRALLARFLRINGYLASCAADAEHARRLLSGLVFDLIVLDVMLPGEDGINLTRSLRGRLGTPIILLTARGETEDRIIGLEAGADDYLVKPFEPRELLLRISAILRRRPEPVAPRRNDELRFGPYRFDRTRGELRDAEQGTRVRLTDGEARLLAALAERPGEPMTRAEIAERLGRESPDGPARAIDVQITRLRRKIEPDPSEPRFLRTVRGTGYMLAID